MDERENVCVCIYEIDNESESENESESKSHTSFVCTVYFVRNIRIITKMSQSQTANFI